jgi:hypothetical protein
MPPALVAKKEQIFALNANKDFTCPKNLNALQRDVVILRAELVPPQIRLLAQYVLQDIIKKLTILVLSAISNAKSVLDRKQINALIAETVLQSEKINAAIHHASLAAEKLNWIVCLAL